MSVLPLVRRRFTAEEYLMIERAAESLRDHVLIAQDSPRVEHYTRMADGAWAQNVLLGLDVSLTLSAVPVTVSLSDLYDRITFPASAQ